MENQTQETQAIQGKTLDLLVPNGIRASDLNFDKLPYGSVGFIYANDKYNFRGFPLALYVDQRVDSEILKISYFNPFTGEWMKAGDLVQKREMYDKNQIKTFLNKFFDFIIGKGMKIAWERVSQ